MGYKITQVHPYFDQDEIKEVTECLKDAWVTEGPKKERFLQELQKITKAKYAVLAPNGTQALYLALMIAGIGPEDEVIVPDFSFVASASSVYWTGAKPVFVDVKKDNLNLDPGLIEKYITKKTKAIIPVHIYGQAADMDPILAIAKKHKLIIIEDAAQGLGVLYKGKHTGTFGQFGCLSFFADKTITTGGEGGAILTNSAKLYDQLVHFRNHGRPKSSTFVHPRVGYNFRLTDLQCAVGVAQIKKFSKIRDRKIKNLDLYKKYLQKVTAVKFLGESKDSNIIPFRANILVQNLSGLIQHLEQKGIQTRRFFYPLHKQPFFRKKFTYIDHDYPNTNYAYNHGLSLPVHMYLTEKDISFVCQEIKNFYGQK